VQVELHERRRVADDLQAVDGRGAQRHLDGDSAAVELVGALAADLHGGGRRNRQLDFPFKPQELLLGCDLGLLDDLAFPVAGGRAQAEADLRAVALVQPDEVAREPRPLPQQDEQEPRRERVERARVPGLRPEPALRVGDDRKRGRPGRFVDQHEPRDPRVTHSEPVYEPSLCSTGTSLPREGSGDEPVASGGLELVRVERKRAAAGVVRARMPPRSSLRTARGTRGG
jgi:hypothetical protein